MKTTLINKHDSTFSAFTKQAFEYTQTGFKGVYSHKKGYVLVDAIQDNRQKYYLYLSIMVNGVEHIRTYECSAKPTPYLASRKAKAFIEEVLS